MIQDLIRYQVDSQSSLPRETVLLVSMGCSWGRCAFCDYQDDRAQTVLQCDRINRRVLQQVRGAEIGIRCLEVTCSASYTELPFTSLNYIRETCSGAGIHTLVLEGHYLFRESNGYFRDFFGQKGIEVCFRCGVETFDEHLRESVLHKGLPGASPHDIAQFYDWINLMFGMEGQTLPQLKRDIEIGLTHFRRVNLSMYTAVEGGPARDSDLIKQFYSSDFYRTLLANPRVDLYDEWDPSNYHSVGHDRT